MEVAQKFTKDKNGKGPTDTGFDVTNVVQWGAEMSLDEESGWSCPGLPERRRLLER